MMSEKIAKAFKVGREEGPDKVTEYYDQWATDGDYDKILLDGGYIGPKAVAGHLARLVNNKDAKILDIGCGTGLVGEELSKLGFTNITALDPSQKSLDVCREKGCYKDFVKSYVAAEKLPIDDHTYDVVISSGVFVAGHCDGTSLKTALRVVKPDGIMVHATRRAIFEDDQFDLREVTEQMVADKVCSLAQDDIPKYSQNVQGVALIYTIL